MGRGIIRLLLVLAGIGLAGAAGAAGQGSDGSSDRQPLYDAWYRVEMLGQRVGHLHTTVTHTSAGGTPAILTVDELHTEVRRVVAGRAETMVTELRLAWLEDLQHQTLQIELHSSQGGGQPSETVAVVTGDRLELVRRRAGEQRRWHQGWPADLLSPEAITARLKALLSTTDPNLVFRSISPELGFSVTEHRLQISERLADGGAVVLDSMSGQELAVRLTLDADGRVQRHETGPVTLERTSQSLALQPLDQDLAAFSGWTVRLDRPVTAELRRAAAYALLPRQPGADLHLADLFLEDERQRIVQRAGRELLLVQQDPDAGSSGEPPPGSALLAASELIESDTSQLRALAARITGPTTSRQAAARALETWVFLNISHRGAGIGLASALETLQSQIGDCTEMAVLLTALLRAAGIPARLVVGLVAVPGSPPPSTLSYHAWVEAWVGHWLALDAALPAPAVDASHLAMARSSGNEQASLAGISAHLLASMGRFDLQLVAPEQVCSEESGRPGLEQVSDVP